MNRFYIVLRYNSGSVIKIFKCLDIRTLVANNIKQLLTHINYLKNNLMYKSTNLFSGPS